MSEINRERLIVGVSGVTQKMVEDWACEAAMDSWNLHTIEMHPVLMKAYNEATYGQERIILTGTAADPKVTRGSQWTSPKPLQGKAGGVVALRLGRLEPMEVMLRMTKYLPDRRCLSAIEIKELGRLAWNFVAQYSKAHFGETMPSWDDKDRDLTFIACDAIRQAERSQREACPPVFATSLDDAQRVCFGVHLNDPDHTREMRYYGLLQRVARQLVYVELTADGAGPDEAQRIV